VRAYRGGRGREPDHDCKRGGNDHAFHPNLPPSGVR
jgi:hypothetical protein